MKVHPKEQTVFEVCLVVPKRKTNEADATYDCVEVLENAFRKVGFIVERIDGVNDEFMKVWLFYLFYFPRVYFSNIISIDVNVNNGC